ncbi:MAG: pyridoxal phosphate-dependent aminotransferase [Candidatus Aenigmarchaeota archaeon]
MNLNRAIQNTPECEATKYFGHISENCINFSVGEPLFKPPESVVNAYVKAVREGSNRYAPIQGYPELREKIAGKLEVENKIRAEPEEILVTNGATEAIGLVLLSLVDKGDEVITCEPNYPIFSPIVKYCGGRAKPLPLREEKGFQIDMEELKGMLSEKTKLLILNTPHNPTGMVLNKNVLKAVSEICKTSILVDEVYEKIIYTGKHHSLASLSETPERIITVNSFSKTYCMCGYRIGYLHAKKEFVQKLLKLKLYLSNCVNASIQKATLAAFDEKEFPERIKKEFEKRKIILMKGFKKLGIPCVEPKGTFYAFPNISEWGNDKKVYDMFLKSGVLTMPGSIFSDLHDKHVRFSFVCKPRGIKEGVERIGCALNKK